MYEWAAFCMNGQFNLGDVRPGRFFFGVSLSIGLILGLSVPIEDEVSRLLTLVQWILQTCLPMAFLIMMHVSLGKVPAYTRLNPWVALLSSGCLAMLLYVPIALSLDLLFEPETVSVESLTEELVDEFFSVLPPVVLFWILINAPFLLGFSIVLEKTDALANANANADSDADTSSPADDEVTSETKKGFLSLIPADLGLDFVYLKAELHYVSVVTTRGSVLILYNLKDAAEEISEQEGMRCHRSYWVSMRHVETFKKDGRQGQLTMRTGDVIPVSRGYMADFQLAYPDLMQPGR